MKMNLFILALVALLGGTPGFAGPGNDRGDIRGDVGGNGQGDGGDVNGDVGGNGQGAGTEFLRLPGFEFYSTAVQLVKDRSVKEDVIYSTTRLLEIMPNVKVKVVKNATRLATSSDRHGAAALNPQRNELVVNETLFDRLSNEEKANVLTHHLSQVAGIIEETVATEIAASVP